MVGKTVLHYKIIEELGRGGMGVVFKAEDTKLKREVAIKFLPHHISANDEERQRFEIEAQAAASLNHPNICTIHSIEEFDSEVFIVMEYIDGCELKSLAETHPDASLQLNNVINYAIQIAEGLAAAHKKGIVHRDIKSQNIMITNDGKVKIMDFGLAKLRGGSQVTKVGSTVGTITYMSPEQARGEEVDHRTDIWSFGVVLYELLTGTLPFKGEYDAAVLYSVLNEEIKRPSEINPGIPAFLDATLMKCLKKNKEERYKETDELINDLKKSTTDPQLSGKETSVQKKKSYITFAFLITVLLLTFFFIFKSGEENGEDIRTVNSPKRLAVLPFTNSKNDKENNYLGFALADQVIGSLSYIKNILVRPSSAVRKYEAAAVNPSDVGNELNVEFILTGNYIKESGVVRLNLELVDIKSNEIIWRNDFDVLYENTFTLQDIVSEKVVSGLKIRFTGTEKHSDTPRDPLAYEYYLKALSYPLTIETTHQAVSALRKAAELDPGYAPVYSELGFRLQLLSVYDLKSRAKTNEAENCYLKALELNENLLDALGNLAAYYTEIGKTIEAVKLIKKALAIKPDNPEARFWLGYIYRYTGMLEESAHEMETALRLDPNNPRFRSIGTTYTYLERYDDAIRGFRLDNESPLSYGWIGVVHFRMNNIDSAQWYLTKASGLDPDGTVGLWSRVLLEYINGNKKEGLKLLDILSSSGTYDGEQFFNYAILYALFEKKEDCLETLKKAIDAGFYCYPLFRNHPYLESVRNEHEFKQLYSDAKRKSDDFRKKISGL